MATDFDNLSSEDVSKIHHKADTDGSDLAVHHTLGPGRYQAAPGNHDHQGGTSTSLLEGEVIAGSRSGSALTSVIALLVKLGATDLTTP